MIIRTTGCISKATITPSVHSQPEDVLWYLEATTVPFAFGTSLRVLANGCLSGIPRKVCPYYYCREQ